MKQDEFKNRYIIKVLSSVLLAVLNTVIQLLLPRIFSVEEYGYYSYNLNVFTSIVVIANLSTSNALVAKFSKRNDETGLVLFYLKFVALVSLIVSVAVAILYPLDFFKEAFAGQTIIIVLLSLETSLVTKLLTDTISMYDASAISRFPAFVQIILKLIICCSVLTGFLIGRYDLTVFYLTQVITTLIAVAVLIYALLKDNRQRYGVMKKHNTVSYIREFWVYCRPLVLAMAFSQLVVIVMNWALMTWSGVSQQALFGIAWQLNSLVTYVFSPYAELSKREFAVISEDKDSLKYRFDQSLRLMTWLTSYFAIFIAFMSSSIVPILFGDKYDQVTPIIAIIMFYTVFQSIGQLTGSYLIAIEDTKANAGISILGQVITISFVFLFQIPNFIWPQTLGSIGIGLNYLLANIITDIISVIYISKTLNASVIKNIFIPVVPMIVFSVLAIVLSKLSDIFFPSKEVIYLIFRIGISGVVYSVIIGNIVWCHPEVIGVNKELLYNLVKRGR